MDSSKFAELAASIEKKLRPYQEELSKHDHLPEIGIDRDEILDLMEKYHEIEASRWEDGFVSGAVYHGNEAYIDFMNRVYAINSQSNPLHPEIWPSTSKFGAEVVTMTANMLSADQTQDENHNNISENELRSG